MQRVTPAAPHRANGAERIIRVLGRATEWSRDSCGTRGRSIFLRVVINKQLPHFRVQVLQFGTG